MRYLNLISLVAFLSWTPLAAQQSIQFEEFIFWDEHEKLAWTDFDGLAKRYSEHGAFSVVGFMTEYKYEDGTHYALIKTYFNRDLSWSKTWTNLLLLHEQGHFDIAEIIAREFRREVQLKMQSGEMNATVFDNMRAEAIKKLNEQQKEYDYSTNYSMKFRVQEKWNQKIEKKLEGLSAYANPVVVVSIQ